MGILVSGSGIASVQTNITHAKESHDSTPQNIKLVGTYDISQVDSKTMKQFKEIEKVSKIAHHGKVNPNIKTGLKQHGIEIKK